MTEEGEVVVISEVRITSEHYRELLEAKKMLDALERAGVDNWEGYDHAMDIYWGGEEVGC